VNLRRVNTSVILAGNSLIASALPVKEIRGIWADA
jgi:hypothetical protein